MNTFLKIQTLMLLLSGSAFFLANQTFAQESDASVSETPAKEIGLVNWGRDYSAAQSISKRTGRPILLLFQEVPGCQGCQDFGEEVLSNPLIVEAAEDLFVPTLVYNNRDGQDAAMLKRFNEPSWNYPVARYLDSNDKDFIPRKEKIWELAGTAKRMVAALKAAKRDVPKYLELLSNEQETNLEKATFAMHCYWEGEAALGSLEGVIGTRSAWLDGKEVVEVDFDPRVIDYGVLVDEAKKMKCASNVYTHSAQQQKVAKSAVGELAKLADSVNGYRDAKESDQKYYLRNSLERVLPLTQAQAVKVNAALIKKASYDHWLSPRQLELKERVFALSAEDQKEMSKMIFPESADKLAGYQLRVVLKLAEFEK